MTTPIKVEQVDRDAAADVFDAIKWPRVAEEAVAGLIDDHAVVQSFTRHRIAAEAKTREEDAQWLQSDATALALCDAIQDIDMELWVGAIMPAGERWEVSKALLGHLSAIRSRMETDNGPR